MDTVGISLAYMDGVEVASRHSVWLSNAGWNVPNVSYRKTSPILIRSHRSHNGYHLVRIVCYLSCVFVRKVEIGQSSGVFFDTYVTTVIDAHELYKSHISAVPICIYYITRNRNVCWVCALMTLSFSVSLAPFFYLY